MDHDGRAVQVDPIKPTLEAPGTKHLKLLFDEPPSNFAFKINYCRYMTEQQLFGVSGSDYDWVGRCRSTLSIPR